jgi:CRP-like cAMP-binding protein
MNGLVRAATGAEKVKAKLFFQYPAQSNLLLGALPMATSVALARQLEFVALPHGKVIYRYGSALDYAYFPVTAIISLVYVMNNGAAMEIGMVGNEGVVGLSTFEDERSASIATVRRAGCGYRLKTEHLRAAFDQGGAFPRLLMRYVNALFAMMAQNSVGAHHSSIEQKLCRWLLERLDRSSDDDLDATQEEISIMLGVRRESVTSAANKLQDDCLIRYRRGHITVLDREGLESNAGECYRAAKIGFDLMREPPP